MLDARAILPHSTCFVTRYVRKNTVNERYRKRSRACQVTGEASPMNRQPLKLMSRVCRGLSVAVICQQVQKKEPGRLDACRVPG